MQKFYAEVTVPHTCDRMIIEANDSTEALAAIQQHIIEDQSWDESVNIVLCMAKKEHFDKADFQIRYEQGMIIHVRS